MNESEGQTPPDVRSGMLLKVLEDSPLSFLQSAVINPGFYDDYPECYTLVINRTDFWYFSELLVYHNLKINYVRQDMQGNSLYSIDDGTPIILKSRSH